MHANIIGAGIAGPMAAITLRDYGYSVDVYETRAEHDLFSHGILNITHKSWDTMLRQGVADINSLQLVPAAEYKGVASEWHNITWTDLHNSLSERARALRVKFNYNSQFDGKPSDLTVTATGVGSAKEVSRSDYTGYSIVRGLAKARMDVQWQWLEDVYGNRVAIGAIHEGISIGAFLPRNMEHLKTTYSSIMPSELRTLPHKWRSVFETVTEWQTTPLSDWTVPNRMIYGTNVRIGDANGQLRPTTAMGANLAIAEAANVELLVQRSERAAQQHLGLRHFHYMEGLSQQF